MSVKLMSAIFETEIHDLPYTKNGEKRKAKGSTCKIVLLALADHANDYGESCFPGYDKMEIKTALSRQGLADTYDALVENGIVTIKYKASRLKTNDYNINIRAFPKMSDLWDELPDTVKPLDSVQSSHLTQTVKPLDHNHQLTISKPSNGAKPAPTEILPLDWQIGTGKKKITMPTEDMTFKADLEIALMNISKGAIHLVPLAEAFIVTRRIFPKKSEYSGWRKVFQSMYDAKPNRVQPEHVIQAIQELEAWKPGVVQDPFTVEGKARSIANPMPETPVLNLTDAVL